MFEEITPQIDIITKVIGIGRLSTDAVKKVWQKKSDLPEYYIADKGAATIKQLDTDNMLPLNDDIDATLHTIIHNAKIISLVVDGDDKWGMDLAFKIAKLTQQFNILMPATIITESNTIKPEELPLTDSFNILAYNESFETQIIIEQSISSVLDLMVTPGVIAVDFVDVKNLLHKSGYTKIGFGEAKGEDRAINATQLAITDSYLNQQDLSCAKGILVQINSGLDLGLDEFSTIGELVVKNMTKNASAIVSTTLEQELTDIVQVTITTTDFA